MTLKWTREDGSTVFQTCKKVCSFKSRIFIIYEEANKDTAMDITDIGDFEVTED